jgi:hypothetical protein
MPANRHGKALAAGAPIRICATVVHRGVVDERRGRLVDSST